MTGDPAYAMGRNQDEYDRLARQAVFLRGSTERLLRAAGLGPGMRVLDVGSGAGDVALLAAEIVGPRGEVVGVDVDGAVLQVARGRAEAAGVGNVRFVEGDALGVGNVRFVEGDALAADVGEGFDAAVGRLVLMYRADPAEALRHIAARVRAGGAVAFQELDMDPAIEYRSLPETTLWNEIGRLLTETFGRAGVHTRMGRQLFTAFTAAGLPAPSMLDEALVGGGPDFAGYAWMAGVARSLAPLMAKLGVADPQELGVDTLLDRVRADTVERNAVVWTPSFVGAYTVKP